MLASRSTSSLATTFARVALFSALAARFLSAWRMGFLEWPVSLLLGLCAEVDLSLNVALLRWPQTEFLQFSLSPMKGFVMVYTSASKKRQAKLKLDKKLIDGKLIRRYKRFLADIELDDGETLTSHCPNSGTMKTCVGDGWKVKLSDSENPKRKLQTTLEWVHNGNSWITVNTHLANQIVFEAIQEGRIPELSGYDRHLREVKVGEKSRIDIVLEAETQKAFVEVKSVTLLGDNGRYQFPDAVTSRGQKHLKELAELVDQGHRGVMFFLIGRADGVGFEPAREIDPEYARLLSEVSKQGVEILAYNTEINPPFVTVTCPEEVHL